jgi:hypothetical protein
MGVGGFLMDAIDASVSKESNGGGRMDALMLLIAEEDERTLVHGAGTRSGSWRGRHPWREAVLGARLAWSWLRPGHRARRLGARRSAVGVVGLSCPGRVGRLLAAWVGEAERQGEERVGVGEREGPGGSLAREGRGGSKQDGGSGWEPGKLGRRLATTLAPSGPLGLGFRLGFFFFLFIYFLSSKYIFK